MIAKNSRAGLAFQDNAALKTILASLAGKPSFFAARIYSVSGDPVAEYGKNNATGKKCLCPSTTYGPAPFHLDR